jgi:hypothetical protein
MAIDLRAGGLCWSCRKPVAAEDNFCRFCGKGLGRPPWYYQHWGIILLTIFGLGPFSIFLVWRSPTLSRTARWIYTAALLALTYWFCVECYVAYMKIKIIMEGIMSGNMPTFNLQAP